tara:strand:+ start:10282 stop:10803 length:522 start_codon:yes stop_codon:yes gene_type:complete
MAKVFSIVSELNPKFSVTGVLVAAGAVGTIGAGTPTKSADAYSTNTGAAVPMVDADGTTAQNFFGIAKSNSTDTVAAAGSVDIWMPLPGVVYKGFAKTASLIDTAAELQALFHKAVLFDLTSTDWTVDTNTNAATGADSKVNCVVIIGGDITAGTVNFIYSTKGTYLNYCVSA